MTYRVYFLYPKIGWIIIFLRRSLRLLSPAILLLDYAGGWHCHLTTVKESRSLD